ncbi:ABC transporter ATP-binding protein [Pontibacter locisalis]|uniref:ABC transporter ATP-binding protein n=1 Tax=Pontibacter locisalis TaxID=1719035 RepID=A0ABW5IUB9_9BACT
MSEVVIKVENLSKQYRLGEVGTGTLKDDFKRWRYRMMGKEDPFLKIGEVNDRTSKSTLDYVWALRDINFEVKKGEVLGIIGRNGAGKSTLLKILSRTTGPTIGSLKMKGRIASLLEVGTGFHGELSGRENIFLNGAIMGMSKAEVRNKFDEIVAFAGVEKYIDTPVKRYSSGMYVRLAFGVAAHLDPDILIIDEVLAVGDVEFQKKAISKIQNVSKGEGKTVLFVSHNMSSIRNLCSTGILLDNGTIIFSGSSSDTVSKYIQLNTTVTNSNLDTRVDREGSGELRFTKVRLLNTAGIESDIFTQGEDVTVELEYEVLDPDFNFSGGHFSVNLFDTQDNHLFCHQSSLDGSSLSNEKIVNNKKVCFVLKGFPFKAGEYKLSCDLVNSGLYVDALENIISFNIIEGNIYKHIRPISAGMVAVQGDWLI